MGSATRMPPGIIRSLTMWRHKSKAASLFGKAGVSSRSLACAIVFGLMAKPKEKIPEKKFVATPKRTIAGRPKVGARGGAARGTDPARVRATLEKLDEAYPAVTCALRHENPFQLLISTILSAQCTDER